MSQYARGRGGKRKTPKETKKSKNDDVFPRVKETRCEACEGEWRRDQEARECEDEPVLAERTGPSRGNTARGKKSEREKRECGVDCRFDFILRHTWRGSSPAGQTESLTKRGEGE